MQSAPLDWFHWAYQFKQQNKHTLYEIWGLVDDKQNRRQQKVKKRSNARRLQRNLSTSHAKKIERSKQILISRNIGKATKILNNVCKGIFPGDYSDH